VPKGLVDELELDEVLVLTVLMLPKLMLPVCVEVELTKTEVELTETAAELTVGIDGLYWYMSNLFPAPQYSY
jgi:hypothetical protein